MRQKNEEYLGHSLLEEVYSKEDGLLGIGRTDRRNLDKELEIMRQGIGDTRKLGCERRLGYHFEFLEDCWAWHERCGQRHMWPPEETSLIYC